MNTIRLAASIISGSALSLCLSAASASPYVPNFKMPEPLVNATVSDKKPSEHRAWFMDFQNGLYARSMLFNTDTGVLLGTVDTGWEGAKLEIPKDGNVFYNTGMFMSRGFRGDRTDVVTVFDKRTLKPLQDIQIEPKLLRGWPSFNVSQLSDDSRFLFVQYFTPASSVGVVDLKAKKNVGEIEAAGCANIMAIGPRRFMTPCGDGSLLTVTVNDAGKEASRKRFSHVFDPDADPLYDVATRAGSIWYFVSRLGVIHPVETSGAELKTLPTWSVAEKDGNKTWVPGPILSPMVMHAKSGILYVLMHPSDLKPKGGGTDYHRDPGVEVWAFDVKTKARLRRIKLTEPAYAVTVSQDDAPLLYTSSLESSKAHIYNAKTGQHLRSVEAGTMPTLVVPVE